MSRAKLPSDAWWCPECWTIETRAEMAERGAFPHATLACVSCDSDGLRRHNPAPAVPEKQCPNCKTLVPVNESHWPCYPPDAKAKP